jgi:hypothetical protein
VNPVPAFIACFLAGYFLGHKVGQLAAYEEIGALFPSFEDMQREAAREGLQ